MTGSNPWDMPEGPQNQWAQQGQVREPLQRTPVPQKTNSGLVVLATVLTVAVLVAVGWFSYQYFSGQREGTSPVTVTSTVQVPNPGPRDVPPIAPPRLEQNPDTDMKLPAGSTKCGDTADFEVYSGNNVTSCPFAFATADALGERLPVDSDKTLRVYSSVTGKSYDMKCAFVPGGNFSCTGGNNAQVLLISAQ